MKKLLLLVSLITLGLGANAQNDTRNNGWPQRHDKEDIQWEADGKHITIDRNTYAWRPFTPDVGYSIYGSRYRKARSTRGWGQVLSLVVAPLSAISMAYSLTRRSEGAAMIGGAILAGSLGAGIPLWVKGQREMDIMLDDYVKRFGPKPYSSSITAGPTMNGVGLAFNF